MKTYVECGFLHLENKISRFIYLCTAHLSIQDSSHPNWVQKSQVMCWVLCKNENFYKSIMELKSLVFGSVSCKLPTNVLTKS